MWKSEYSQFRLIDPRTYRLATAAPFRRPWQKRGKRSKTVLFGRDLCRRLDVRPLDVIEVRALDADQLRHRVALGRMDHVHIVEVRIAGTQDVDLLRLDQRRVGTVALPHDLPVGHLGVTLGEAIDRPARA